MTDTLTLGPQLMDPASLHESPVNPRTINDERFEALKRGIEYDPKMLEARPVIATPEGEVVAGNMRLRAVKELGWGEVPVFVAELTAMQQREWMLRDNQEYGEYVPDQLARLIEIHAQDGGDVSMLGFKDEDVSDLLRTLEDGEAVIPEPDEQTDPALKAEILIEVYCSREAFDRDVESIIGQLEGIEGAEVNIST